MQVQTILDQIDIGQIALPEFQRGYVWNRDQVRGLMASLYQRHPVGSLLVWVTQSGATQVRGTALPTQTSVRLLLDGQQRITTLYGIIRGNAPAFFDGNSKAFTGLYFNVEEETFGFYAPIAMADNPLWISVTTLMLEDVTPFIQQFMTSPQLSAYVTRLSRLRSIREIDFHIAEITGEDKTVDVVVDIFNRVNSGGTKLSKGDLALARICAEWPDARAIMRKHLDTWRASGYDFELDWLLRNVTTVLTGQAMFSALDQVDAATFQSTLEQTAKTINTLLNLVANRLGLDHDRVLAGRYAFPVMTRYLSERGGKFGNVIEQEQLLYWYVQSFIWGRYAGSTETVLNQDLRAAENGPQGLIDQLRRSRGTLSITSGNFQVAERGSRFYPLLYLLTRVHDARDWGTGLPLKANLLGKSSVLHVHHIFPKARLYAAGFQRAEVNTLANYSFQTQDTNLQISDQRPEVYFHEIEARYPGVLASQWIPLDESLWTIERYPDFVAARRELLSAAANTFLESLLHAAPQQVLTPITDITPHAAAEMASVDEEDVLLRGCQAWVQAQGLPPGVLLHEVVDLHTSEPLVQLDLAWPRGLQEGLSQPVAILLNETTETEEAANNAGYRFFTNIDDFKAYVEREVLSTPEPVAAD